MADLDRLVTLTIRDDLVYDDVDGEFVPGPITFRGVVWARYADLGSGSELDGGLIRTISYRNFMIRWRQDLVSISNPHIRIAVEDESSNAWVVRKIGEPEPRRRYMDIETVRQT